MKITYLDQIIITGKFQNIEQIKAVKPRVVEAVGYLVKEDDTGYLIASTINGGAYNNLLFIPKTVVQEADYEFTGVEVEYHETQGISKQIPTEKAKTLPAPPMVKMCGIEACRAIDDETGHETVYIAQERNADGNFRTITAIPVHFVKDENTKKQK